jgi:hypothetical protein
VFGEMLGSLVHGLFPFSKGPGHVRISNTGGSGYQSGDEVLLPGGMAVCSGRPSLHPALQDGGGVVGIVEAAWRQQGKDCIDIQPGCSGVVEGGVQCTACGAETD